MSLANFDPNMGVAVFKNEQDYDFLSADSFPFRCYGLIKEHDGIFRRMPQSVAASVSEGVAYTNAYTSGGRFVFRTNADRIALKVKMPSLELQRSVNFMNCAGMDIYLYKDGKQKLLSYFRKPQMDPNTNVWMAEALLNDNSEEKDIIIYTSAYATLKEIYIGVPKGCYVKEAEVYSVKEPVVFYGSSITQGASASRPALTYPALLSQELDFDFINLGFAGNGKGEQEMADYIASLSMSAFVYDYDHNAPSVEHLAKTHENMYLTIRRKNPFLPVIMMSRPHYHTIGVKETEARFKVIAETYRNARERGENVYLLDGRHFYDKFGYSNCVQDASHPNTLGMYAMYDAVLPALKESLKIKRGT